jgi:hypothetical protein
MARASRTMMILLATVTALGAGLPATATSTAAQAEPKMGQVPAATAFPGGLAGVSATSSTDAWAVGASSRTR